MMKKVAWIVVTVITLVMSMTAPVNAQGSFQETPPDEDMIAVLAEAAGMTREALLQELLAGKTIQEVLEENDVSRQALALMQQEKQRPVAERTAITALANLLGMSRAEFYQALADGYTINALLYAQGFTHEDFIEAYRATATEQINQALADGKIDEEQAQKLLDKLDDEDFGEQWLLSLDRKQMEQLANRVKNFARAGVIAPILGMEEETLKESLRNGSSLAEIIDDAGMDEQDVFTQLIDTAIAEVEAAFDKGKITQEQRDRLIERMQAEDFGQVAWQRALNASFDPRDLAARRILQQMHELVEKFHRSFGH